MKVSYIIISVLFFSSFVYSQNESSLKVQGKVVDSIKQTPVNSAELEIPKLNQKKYSDANGDFLFDNLKEGYYELIISADGYFSIKKYISVSKSNPYLILNISLRPFESITDTIEVNTKYFKKDDMASTGFINVDYEEFKKTPGTIDDVIRHFESSPGVSITTDMANEYIVRGGAPIENQILIDNIELPNPNHFAPPGTNSGAFSYINIQMISEANFYTGGFPVIYGDKLSSVLDIKFKDGNEKIRSQSLDLSLAGLGISADGPLSNKITYSLSARRSYFELFKSQFRDLPIPNYWDINLKLKYKLGPYRLVSFTSLSALDNTSDPDNMAPGARKNVKVKLFANGINYENNSNKIKYRLTGFYDLTLYNIDYYSLHDETLSGIFSLKSTEHEAGLNVSAKYDMSTDLTLDFISGLRYFHTKDTLYTFEFINESDYASPSQRFARSLDMVKSFLGVNAKYKFLKDIFTFNAGIRTDFTSYITHHFTFSPRAMLSCRLSKKTMLNASAGIYYETPEILWLLCDPDNKDLLSLKVEHFVLGAEHYILPNFRINAEAYYKQYENYPVDMYNPILMYINSGTDIRPNFIHKAASKGNGYFIGSDLSIEYKNSGEGFYGMLNLSLSTSGFAALEGGILPGEFDYGKQILFIAGYQLPGNWSFGLRLKYSGPRPTLSYDTVNSAFLGMDYYNKSRYLKDKLPYYMRADLRVDKMFRWGNFTGSIYAEVENIFNRDNIYTLYWNPEIKGVSPFYNLSILPVLGFNVKF